LWGILGSMLAGISILTVTVLPDLEGVLMPAVYIPVGIFEIVVGFRLLLGRIHSDI